MLLFFTSLLVWVVLSSAVTYCRSSATVPTLASCDRALVNFETFVQRFGDGEKTFGYSDSSDFILPIVFVDPEHNAGDGRCSIILFWDPKPRFPSPPEGFDRFRSSKLLRAVFRIRDRCLQINRPGQVSRGGYEWIEPRQWVRVEIGTCFGNGCYSSNATGIDGDLVIGTANGTNMTISVSKANEGNVIELVKFWE